MKPLNDSGWKRMPWPDGPARERDRVAAQQEADTRANAVRDTAEERARVADLQKIQKRQPKRLPIGGDNWT
jgi:hypothetical protein